MNYLRWWIMVLVSGLVSTVPFNQPKFCSNASWNANAVTFAGNSPLGKDPHSIFINKQNSVYAVNRALDDILVWNSGSSSPWRTISTTGLDLDILFVSTSEEIYVATNGATAQVLKYTLNSSVGVQVMPPCLGECNGLFIDDHDDLFCSITAAHQVIAKSLTNQLDSYRIIAGTGKSGADSYNLNEPYGIYVTADSDLYVADCQNDRVQFFPSGQSTGQTVAGNGALGSITLNCPVHVLLDGNGHLFITDYSNARIIGPGPSGLRCLVGCTSSGTQSHQLNHPRTFAFDTYGNLFVVDRDNDRIQQFNLTQNACGQSVTTSTARTSTTPSGHTIVTPTVRKIAGAYNQPKLHRNASWNANGITFASSNTVGTNPNGIAIDTDNTIVVANRQNHKIAVWFNGDISPSRMITAGLSEPSGIFLGSSGEIFIDNGQTNERVDRYSTATNSSLPVMYIDKSCYSLFLSVDDVLYCSNKDKHRVVAKSMQSNFGSMSIVAGTGCSGATANQLNHPHGIFVNIDLDLYVADCDNDRVQLFQSGQRIGITVAGSLSINVTITLHKPRGVILDADHYLFIVDSDNHRIVRSGPNGFRCIIACSGQGSQADELKHPSTMAFDIYGNLFVVDRDNDRIQKFTLTINYTESFTSTVRSTTQPVTTSTSTHARVDSTSTTSKLLTTIITSKGQTSSVPETTTKVTQQDQTSVITSLLTSAGKVASTRQGNAMLTSTVTSTNRIPTNPTSSTGKVSTPTGCSSPRLKVFPPDSSLHSPLTYRRSDRLPITSLIEWGCTPSSRAAYRWTLFSCTTTCSSPLNFDRRTSELLIVPRSLPNGLYRLQLTATVNSPTRRDLSSHVFIRIISSSIRVNLLPFGTSMITVSAGKTLQLNPGKFSIDPDETRFHPADWNYEYFSRVSNNSFSSLNLSWFQYSADPSAPTSAVTIFTDALHLNELYQFRVLLTHREDPCRNASGDVLIHVGLTAVPEVFAGCVIENTCARDADHSRLINPTSELALFSTCQTNDTPIEQITWNVYERSSNVTSWIPFHPFHPDCFFGRNSTRFTVCNRLFLSRIRTLLWRFEVVYRFPSGTSTSALHFTVNSPPTNGTCTLSPLHGLTSTLFTIVCTDWFDEHGIRDYSLYRQTNESTDGVIHAFSIASSFDVRLPPGDDQLFTVVVRDRWEAVAKFELMAKVSVRSDSLEVRSVMENSSTEVLQILQSGNQNLIGQTIDSFAQQLNAMNDENIEQATSNGIPRTSLCVSSLGTLRSPSPLDSNQSNLSDYNLQLNSLSNTRQWIIQYLADLIILGPDSLQLQSSVLVQLSRSTNQLTRQTLTMISDRCFQFSTHLHSIARELPVEDVRKISHQLIQCASNVFNAINGPLQGRATVLDSDRNQAKDFPKDYESDVELPWANPNLFADGEDFSRETIDRNRNIYEQKLLATRIVEQVNGMIAMLTSSVNAHLNVEQVMIFNTSEVFMSVQSRSVQSLLNQSIEQPENGRIKLPERLQLNRTADEKISIRSMMKPLASFGNSSESAHTNLSRSISLTLLDEEQAEIDVQTNGDDPIELVIPRDPHLIFPDLSFQNVTSTNERSSAQLFQWLFINITSPLSISIHWQIRSLDTTVAYLFIYKFDRAPLLNTSIELIDGWTILCPSADELHSYFLDNEQTVGHRSLIVGLRELNESERLVRCSNTTFARPPIVDQRVNFTSNYHLRVFTSACLYLDRNNQWKSDGLRVGGRTNEKVTQCYSRHLTTFAGGLVILPAPINWNYVFANADFLRNKTIYLSVICVLTIFVALLIYSRRKDQKDLEKLQVMLLDDNQPEDQYWYQMVVLTGQRSGAGTKSKVHFVLWGSDDETSIRTLSHGHRSILQRGNVDAFVFSVPKSLGLINCLRLWHDNTGRASSSSWFLKSIVVRDLQTMQINHFICQRWFAVEKDDGKIERVLPVAGEEEMHRWGYLLSKNTFNQIADGHLWFSIFSRPPSSHFTRVQRCTCCFVLLFVVMFCNIMYYDLSTNHNDQTFQLQWQQIIVGIIVEFLAFLPSLLVVELFRRIRPRRTPALDRVPSNESKTKKRSALSFPWWFVFVAYGLCGILLFISVICILARGIEFGEVKTQKWLTSIVTGFFSSILLTQPLKIISLAMLVAFFCRKSDANEWFDEEQQQQQNDQPSMRSRERCSTEVHRLSKAEIAGARAKRLVDMRVWSLIRETCLYVCFVVLLSLIVYPNRDEHFHEQVQHLRKSFDQSDYTKISTLDEYWKWMDETFVGRFRAQQWYNGESPHHLSGYLADRSTRMIGWPVVRQLRIRSHPCPDRHRLSSTCRHDYSVFEEDQFSYSPGWSNSSEGNFSSFVTAAFEHRRSEAFDSSMIVTDHHTYSGNGYVYEMRGRLAQIRTDLSVLRQLDWIDRHTRALIVQMTLYNPNVELFTSVMFLSEMFPTGGFVGQMRFEPMNFTAFRSVGQLICTVIYFVLIVYVMHTEIGLIKKFKRRYVRRVWSMVNVGLIVCSWTCVGIYVWRWKEVRTIGRDFRETNGFVWINLQRMSYVDDLLRCFVGVCVFAATMKFIRLCRFDARLCLFVQTLKYAASELLSFAMMCSVIFVAFLSLFFLLFHSKWAACASVLRTMTMLMEMTLMNFNANELIDAGAFLGPVVFCFFVLLVVFVCLSMFVSIVNQNFNRARDNAQSNEQIYARIFDKIRSACGKTPS